MRQIMLDTETTGMGDNTHRIIEIGCIELLERRRTGRVFHCYFNPERLIDPEAIRVHGISDEFVADKPLFASKAQELFEFLQGAELIAHNAAFDVAFLNLEFGRVEADYPKVAEMCKVTDTLAMARKKHPGQRNSLDALVKRYAVEERDRTFHGALLDAEILADVYLAMTGGQVDMLMTAADERAGDDGETRATLPVRRLSAERAALPVLPASADECERHEARLKAIDKASGGQCQWRLLEPAVT